MKAFEISQAYNWNKIMDLRKDFASKKIPFVLLLKNGKKLFVTHGSRDGQILMEKEYNGLYDEIICCWKDTNEINWITFRKYEEKFPDNGIIKSIWHYFLVTFPTSERVNLNENEILAVCNFVMSTQDK